MALALQLSQNFVPECSDDSGNASAKSTVAALGRARRWQRFGDVKNEKVFDCIECDKLLARCSFDSKKGEEKPQSKNTAVSMLATLEKCRR